MGRDKTHLWLSLGMFFCGFVLLTFLIYTTSIPTKEITIKCYDAYYNEIIGVDCFEDVVVNEEDKFMRDLGYAFPFPMVLCFFGGFCVMILYFVGDS